MEPDAFKGFKFSVEINIYISPADVFEVAMKEFDDFSVLYRTRPTI